MPNPPKAGGYKHRQLQASISQQNKELAQLVRDLMSEIARQQRMARPDFTAISLHCAQMAQTLYTQADDLTQMRDILTADADECDAGLVARVIALESSVDLLLARLPFPEER